MEPRRRELGRDNPTTRKSPEQVMPVHKQGNWSRKLQDWRRFNGSLRMEYLKERRYVPSEERENRGCSWREKIVSVRRSDGNGGEVGLMQTFGEPIFHGG